MNQNQNFLNKFYLVKFIPPKESTAQGQGRTQDIFSGGGGSWRKRFL